jgi:glycosyltransferase involved in cell wall biosynthesis
VSGETVSVLLPVHADIPAKTFRAALDSLAAQTRPADEVVVVEDGPLTVDHDRVIDQYAASRDGVVRVRLATNQGAGVANGAGLRAATGTWIAKMDADDLLLPHRFETQLAALKETGADLCGAAMWEFDHDPERPTRLRTNPATHEAIARRMRFNNPINHPTAMYRRELALRVGGYPSMRFMQDYDLMARMLAGGARMTNLPEPLVLFRAGDGMLRRRSARGYLALERELQRNLRSYGLVGRGRAAVNLTVRGAFRVLPRWGLSRAYARFLSTPVPDVEVESGKTAEVG